MRPFLLIASLISVFSGTLFASVNDVVYSRGDYTLSGQLCRPKGKGPFPTVIFNHGGLGNRIGGAPSATCAALAKAGYVGFSPIRRATRPLFGHQEDVNAAIDFIKSQPYVNRSRIGVMGFSRGAMLTYQAVARRNDIKAAVVMAVAVNRFLDLSEARAVSAPVLLLVAKNDTGSRRTRGRNTLRRMNALFSAFQDAGKDARMIVYPPYGDDGHSLFFKVGGYWPDVLRFWETNL